MNTSEIREGIMELSEWPPIPQLYVRGEFVGGCDSIGEMHESRELKALFYPKFSTGALF